MKDYLEFNDEDLAVFIKKHKGTIHTREFPTRCSTCRFIARFQAAEEIAELAALEEHNRLDLNNGYYTDEVAAWKKIADK
jgi:hypothetical protein